MVRLKTTSQPQPQPLKNKQSPPKLNSSILIIGGGTWGISTALHLARRGYKNITVLDAHPIPLTIAAGNDINKILELSSSAPRAQQNDALHGWGHDAVFKGLFHETGAICAATSEEGVKALNHGDGPSQANGWTPVTRPEDLRALMPAGVLTGDFPGWQGWHRKDDTGWVEAKRALTRAFKEASLLGVHFIVGPRGRVTSLIVADNDIKGAIVEYGPLVYADKIILTVGASAPQLLDMKAQLRPTAWTLSHIQMSPAEAQLYKDLPVLFNIERGFFIEPDAETHHLKICDEHPGYTNRATSPTTDKAQSIPFAHQQIPRHSEARVRQLLRETMPYLATRLLLFARICWCADTPDRAFLVSRHPEYASLVLGVGGSGHGFSYMPAIGGVIADCLEGRMDPAMEERFRWRAEMARGRDWSDKQGRFGPEGSDRVMDFKEVDKWTEIPYMTVGGRGEVGGQ